MSRGSKVGGTKRRVLDIVGFAAIVVLFLLYMVPFILVLLNSFKQKRDIIKNPFSRVFFALMAASMIIPFQAIMIPLVSIYGSGLHMLNHRLTLIFMHTGFAMSMSVFIYQGFIRDLSRAVSRFHWRRRHIWMDVPMYRHFSRLYFHC